MATFSPVRVLCVVALYFILCQFSPVARCQTPQGSEFDGIDLGWLTDMRSEIDQQVERFSSAYSLTPEGQENLRAQLVARLPQQWQFESKGFKAVQEQIEAAQSRGVNLEEDSVESKEIMEKFRVIGEIGPLNDLVIAKELESGMDTAVAEQGRMRLVELLARRDQIVSVRDDDFELQSGHNGSISDAKLAAVAPVTAEGNPLPRGGKLPSIAPEVVGKAGGETAASMPVQPNSATPATALTLTAVDAGTASSARAEPAPNIDEVKAAADALLAEPGKTEVSKAAAEKQNGRTAKSAVAKAADHINKPAPAKGSGGERLAAKGREAVEAKVRDAGPSRPMPAAVEAVRLQAAPPLDDWDKYVDTTCKKFDFSDAQVIKAQSILKDLRNRASAYRTGRNEDFAAAERLTDAKAKADRKKELSAPIDAFFEELKQRLDNLATLEQRAKASAAAPGKK